VKYEKREAHNKQDLNARRSKATPVNPESYFPAVARTSLISLLLFKIPIPPNKKATPYAMVRTGFGDESIRPFNSHLLQPAIVAKYQIMAM
jgi:hypothetical protein